MANSFRSDPSVICMIGIEYYNPDLRQCCASIASITRRSDEKTLVLWLLEQLDQFHQRRPNAKLLSFSGLDNDIRWIRERLDRMKVEAPLVAVLDEMDHVDLKVEFYRRTQNDKISLKRLEEICGIERHSSVTSKKVSYILTDLIRKDHTDAVIPERLHGYLFEDVHHLLLIFDRWPELRLDKHNLPDEEVHMFLESIIRTVNKFIQNNQNRNGYQKDFRSLTNYLNSLRQRMKQVQADQSFENFSLPELPDLKLKHPEFERIRKKHRFLDGIQVIDAETGAYRLRRILFKPQGALAVVRHEGKLLMIRRAESLKRAAGFWGLPGGEVEKGEPSEDCAVRELGEELGLTGAVTRVLGTSASFNGEFELTWVEIEVEDIKGLTPNREEVGDVRWVTPEELRGLEPLIPGALEGFARFLGGEWGKGQPEPDASAED
ncbi:MAG: NUDIX hydrolase [SAR324 cluster bacterium]|nr:NUDIX hydrolase [SAR324 cluster bacterium]